MTEKGLSRVYFGVFFVILFCAHIFASMLSKAPAGGREGLGGVEREAASYLLADLHTISFWRKLYREAVPSRLYRRMNEARRRVPLCVRRYCT